MRELTEFEIDYVSGGNWFQDLTSAIASFVGQAVQITFEVVEWFFENFDVTSGPDGVTVSTK